MENRSALFSREDLEAALDSAGVGMWSWTVGDPEVRWSALMERYVGFKPGSYEDTLEAYVAAIHADDRDRVKAQLDLPWVPGGAPVQLEHRMHVRGELRWLESRAMVEFDDQGKVRLINAKDSMPDGGTVNVSARAQVLEGTDRRRPAHLPSGRYFVIEVTDVGVGMGAAVLSHLFEPFFSTKGLRGTGLGLATCHGIAVRAGGGLTVHSVQGRGSTFWVVLPIADEKPAPHAGTQVSIGGTEWVLLVEDEPMLRRIAHRALSDRGYAVTDVGSGEEALALSPEELARFALVVSDVGLPGINGITLVKQLLVSWPKLKVLLTSGYLPDAEAEEALARGELQFLPKPFSAEGLARRVREVLDA